MLSEARRGRGDDQLLLLMLEIEQRHRLLGGESPTLPSFSAR
jgi:hypothetical protein